MRFIPLQNSTEKAIVDDEDYAWASQYTWYCVPSPDGATYYAARYVTSLDGRVDQVYLHDIGKFSSAWQQYLLASEADPAMRGHGPDHRAAGSHLAFLYLQPLALVVAGHHGPAAR